MANWFLISMAIQVSRDKQSFNRQCWHNWISTSERMTVGPLSQPHTRSTLKLINDLNIRAKTIELLEET